MNLGFWADGAWADGAWVPESWGEEEVIVESVVEPARTPADFVISPPYYSHLVEVYRQVLSDIETKQHEEHEFHEMMQMYAVTKPIWLKI